MKIAVLTEGESEYGALPALFEQLAASTGNEFGLILRLPVQPDGPADKIARACKSLFAVLSAKGAESVIIVLDREARSQAPGRIAEQVYEAVARHCDFGFDVDVVIKDRSFENWVIADVDALKAQRARFNVTTRLTNAVVPDRADSANALELLKQATIGSSYDKRVDSARTLRKVRIERLAANSRSFRHFLHVAGHSSYKQQCRRPAA